MKCRIYRLVWLAEVKVHVLYLNTLQHTLYSYNMCNDEQIDFIFNLGTISHGVKNKSPYTISHSILNFGTTSHGVLSIFITLVQLLCIFLTLVQLLSIFLTLVQLLSIFLTLVPILIEFLSLFLTLVEILMEFLFPYS